VSRILIATFSVFPFLVQKRTQAFPSGMTIASFCLY
jgi:hypothetical protein